MMCMQPWEITGFLCELPEGIVSEQHDLKAGKVFRAKLLSPDSTHQLHVQLNDFIHRWQPKLLTNNNNTFIAPHTSCQHTHTHTHTPS